MKKKVCLILDTLHETSSEWYSEADKERIINHKVAIARTVPSIDQVLVCSSDEQFFRNLGALNVEGLRIPLGNKGGIKKVTLDFIRKLFDKHHAFDKNIDWILSLDSRTAFLEPDDVEKMISRFEEEGADLLADYANLIHEEADDINRDARVPADSQYPAGNILLLSGSMIIDSSEKANIRRVEFQVPLWKAVKIGDEITLKLSEMFFLKWISPRLSTEIKHLEMFKPDLIVYDFDGVMTDSKAIVFQDGTEGVTVNRSDGMGILLLRKAGFNQIVLSTESNNVVTMRANKLKLEVYQNSSDKRRDLEEYCRKNGYNPERILYIGNDINDLEVMKYVGFSVAPADAHSSVIKIADYITNAKGGDGVVREVADIILAAAEKR